MKQRVTVIGAGAFGGWSAWWLQRRGADVTLVDAWGAGNARASSGGETRAIRAIYGRAHLYTEWVARALEIWRESERMFGTRLYVESGVLWMCGTNDAYVRSALPALEKHGLGIERLERADAQRRFPEVMFDGIENIYLEASGGTLFARRACHAVAEAFRAEGGTYLEARVLAPSTNGAPLGAIELEDGTRLESDVFVFACGPWLPALFPDLLGTALRVTRQEVYYFGAPPGFAPTLPVWVDVALDYYGLPQNEGRGFKVAGGERGAPFDPTTGDRLPSAEGVRNAREFLTRRFPALRDAPLVEARVCQYTNTADQHLIIDSHPHAPNVWIVGGGSGHGFKLGPALGERVAEQVLAGQPKEPQLSLARSAERAAGRGSLFEQTGG